jgi:pimeloyl-ACP methyl ester carboxylesterase
MPTNAPAIGDHQASIGSQTIRYLEAGSGDTLVVLVHGWPQNADEWRQVIPIVAAKYRVIAPDLRGIGGSRSDSRDYTKVALARDLHAFISSLGAKRTILVGHDIGGMVAYAYVQEFPGTLAGAAILDVPIPGLDPWDWVITIPQAWHFNFHAQAPLAEQLVQGRQEQYIRFFVDHTAGQPTTAITDEDVALFAKAYGTDDQLSAGFGFYRTFAEDAEYNKATCDRVDTPILVAGADRSFGGGVEALAAAMRERGFDDVEVATISDSGHWIGEEQPDATAKLITDFVGRLSR